MTIAVVGCGAVGGFYGARLCRAGHHLHCLLRKDYDTVARHGLQIQSPDGDFTVHPQVHRSAEEIGPVDLVIVALKTTANAALPGLLPPLVGPSTLVLSLQNGLGDEETIAGIVGAERVLGGLCFVCLNRIRPGLVRHLAHGLIVLGEHLRPPMPRTHELARALQQAAIPCRVTDNLAQSHWEKLVWNIPFNGLGVAGAAGWDAVSTGQVDPDRPLEPTLSTDRLLADPRWEDMVRGLMLEVIQTSRALGFSLQPDLAETQIERTRVMADYKASSLLDFDLGKPMELDSMFLEPLRRARAACVHTPRLEALCRVLGTLDATRTTGNS